MGHSALAFWATSPNVVASIPGTWPSVSSVMREIANPPATRPEIDGGFGVDAGWRVQIAPAAVVTQSPEAKETPTVAVDAKSFPTEVQVLTSRPLLQNVFNRLKESDLPPDLGPDPIAAMQQMLHAEPIAGTQIVELSAESPGQALVAPQARRSSRPSRRRDCLTRFPCRCRRRTHRSLGGQNFLCLVDASIS